MAPLVVAVGLSFFAPLPGPEVAPVIQVRPLEFEHVVVDADAPRNPHIKVAGDVNSDGRADLVAASSAGGPLVWYTYPDWTRHVIAPAGTWSCDAKLADMDGDGDLDLVISEWYTYDRLEWWENPLPKGDPARDPWQQHIIGSPKAHNIEVGDIDGDGRLELCTRRQGDEGSEFIIWTRREPEAWDKRVIPCPTGEGLALGDVNGDGRLDVVIGGLWFEAPADLARGEWTAHGFADWPADCVVRIADMNADGRPDIVAARSEGPHHLSWFEAPPDPRTEGWKEHVVDGSVDFAHSLAVCDLNGDGHPDIVAAEMHQSPRKRVMVYLNEGDSLTWLRQVVADTGSHNLCVLHIDGRPALFGANWSGPYQAIELWRQTGR